jgi:CRISPR-associated protein Cmr2
MIYDTAAFIIQQQGAAIDQLRTQEQIAREARSHDARDQAGRYRSQLAQSAWPAALYHAFGATKWASSVEFRTAWQAQNGSVDVRQVVDTQAPGLYDLVYDRPKINLTPFPFGSFALRFTFTLAQPYISGDEEAFYVVDNPVRKDRLSQLPAMAAASWKGSVRAAMWRLGHRRDDAVVDRLLGRAHAEESEETSRAGRVSFFPTFFGRRALEIINPQDRLLRSGTNPILFESVPAGTLGKFMLLYVPFDLIGSEEREVRRQVSEDLALLVSSVRAMLCDYGFGAKSRSGFGLARQDVKDASLSLRVPVETPAQKIQSPTVSPPQSELERYFEAPGRLKPEYRNEDGTFRVRTATELQSMRKTDRKLYEKARKWWDRQNSIPQASRELAPIADELADLDTLPITEREFSSLDALDEQVHLIAKVLRGEGN